MIPDVPDALRVPEGEELVLKAHAIGFQIYMYQAAADGGRWLLKAPEAELFDDEGTVTGSHFAGPGWRLADGSQITGKLSARAESQDPNAIPWLLLTVAGREGSGALGHISTIQRIHTCGGKAPCEPGRPGEEVRISYSADYYFYAARGGWS